MTVIFIDRRQPLREGAPPWFSGWGFRGVELSKMLASVAATGALGRVDRFDPVTS